MTAFQNADDLVDWLDGLNESGLDQAAIEVQGILWLAYCTDPDGEWFFESGDPVERTEYDEHGERVYERITLDWLRSQIENGGPGALVVWPNREMPGPCDLGPCSALKGHAGTCAEASGWDELARKRTKEGQE